jgi:ParB family chromosome partitioning protein
MLLSVSIDRLTLSYENVRKTDLSVAHDEMVASLLHHGLQQNLVVVPSEEPGRYEVVAGGRRLAALKELRVRGLVVPNIGEEWAIPCRVADARDAAEISLAENVVRVAMHPADQFEAWTRLAEEGKTPAETATRFGVSERTVRQRLKLGRVAPELMQAFREDKLTLDALTAFTICDDAARQLDVWEKMRQGYVNPHAVRRMLTEGSVPSCSKLARFVGEADYERAGGLISRDLFEQNCYFENAALLESLALRKLQDKAEELKASWSHVDVRLDPDHAAMRGHAGMRPSVVGAPVGLAEEFSRKSVRYESLSRGEYEDKADEEELQEEFERLEEELAELRERLLPYTDYTDEQKRTGRLFVWIGHDGSLETRAALPIEAAASETAGGGDAAGSDERGGAASAVSPDSAYSASLRDDLAIYRTSMLQAAVGESFAAAFDLMAYTLALPLLREKAGYARSPINARVERYRSQTSLKDLDAAASGAKRNAQRQGLASDWANIPDAALRFRAFCSLPEEEKRKIFAYCVAEGLEGGLSGAMPKECEMTAARLGVRAHEEWRPGESAFFKRLKKAQLLFLVADVIGERHRANQADRTRGEIASWLGRVFAGDPVATSGMDAAALERIAVWTPDGMEYAEGGDISQSDAEAETEIVETESADVVPIRFRSEEAETQSLPAWLLEGDAA